MSCPSWAPTPNFKATRPPSVCVQRIGIIPPDCELVRAPPLQARARDPSKVVDVEVVTPAARNATNEKVVDPIPGLFRDGAPYLLSFLGFFVGFEILFPLQNPAKPPINAASRV